jgi:hypothetical protein
MKITIDNLGGLGPVDYTAALDASIEPRIERKLNQPAAFSCTLLAGSPGFVDPLAGARIVVTKETGEFLFTGYLTKSPECEYLGWGQSEPVYRYGLFAESDEVLLDQKALPVRAPLVGRTAGSALKQLVENLLPGRFDTSGVADVDVLAVYQVNPQKTFSHHAGQIASAVRGCYRVMNGAITLSAAGATTYAIGETDHNFSPGGLKLMSPKMAVNDVTVVGREEPQAYVRDYFVGDERTQRFYLSQQPFQQSRRALVDEKYLDLNPTMWKVSDPASAISVGAQALHVDGGSGQEEQATVSLIERMELGGALELQHGDVIFTGGSRGVIGGLYSDGISAAGCLAGFQLTSWGSESTIQGLINGSVSGPVMQTSAGHRYLLTTYLYSQEIYRSEETFHGAAHPAGNGLGGAAVPANVRVVLQVQEVDPNVPASMVAPATVLFDGVLLNAPGFCTYALVNAADMHCRIQSTYAAHIALAEVRTALKDQTYETRLVESIAEGGECAIVGSTTLDFYPPYVPPLDTHIVVSYRGAGRAVAEVRDTASIQALKNGVDDGVRSIVRSLEAPSARTQVECENAALAMLADAVSPAWLGTYETWSDFLPEGARDIFAGDGLDVDVPSRSAVFGAIVRRVEIEMSDPGNDRGIYTIEFANDLAQMFAMREEATGTTVPMQDLPVCLAITEVGSYYLPSLTNAEITQVSSTTVQVDAGMPVPNGCGIEVRMHDFGWSASNDRNLLGRFGGRTFTLPRLGRTQMYFLRLYDSSSQPRYSRYAAALHVDYPYA